MSKFSVLFLAGGYGTRLASDVEKSELLEWKYLKDSPKALVRLDGQPLLSRWIHQLEEIISEVDKICVVTNDKFYEKFRTWMNMLDNKEIQKKIVLYNNLSSSNEDRLGSVTDLQHGVRMLQDNQEISNPVFVIASDTIFSREFSVASLLRRFRDLGDTSSSIILAAPCREDDVKNHGMLEIDEGKSMRVTTFLEKPLPSETKSRTQSPCCYFLCPAALRFSFSFSQDIILFSLKIFLVQ